MGAVLLELDYLPKSWNYLDTIARWPERYHRYKYEGCDWYMRKGFIDHFFAPNTTLEKFDRMSYQEMGDFIDQPFELEELKREQRKLIMLRHGQVRIKRKSYPVTLRKSYRFKENGIELSIAVINGGSAPIELWYGLEFNLALAGKGDKFSDFSVQIGEKEKRVSCEATALDSINSVWIDDKANGVRLSLGADRAFSLWSLPVETVCYEREKRTTLYQGSCFVSQWEINLQPEQQDELKVSIDLRKG
jgi:alpha-amylase